MTWKKKENIAPKTLRGRSRALKELKRSCKLSEIQRQVLIGLLLGDGHMEKNKRHHRLIYAQGIVHQEYLQSLEALPHSLHRPSTYCTAEEWSTPTIFNPLIHYPSLMLLRMLFIATIKNGYRQTSTIP